MILGQRCFLDYADVILDAADSLFDEGNLLADILGLCNRAWVYCLQLNPAHLFIS